MATQLESLTIALGARNIDVPSSDVLDQELADASDAINMRRGRSYPYENPDLELKYFSLQVQLCIEAILKMGIEGELSHAENGIANGYSGSSKYSPDTLNKVIPLIGVKSREVE